MHSAQIKPEKKKKKKKKVMHLTLELRFVLFYNKNVLQTILLYIILYMSQLLGKITVINSAQWINIKRQ